MRSPVNGEKEGGGGDAGNEWWWLREGVVTGCGAVRVKFSQKCLQN